MSQSFNFSDFVFGLNRDHGTNTAFIDQHGDISYHELESLSRGLASRLSEFGISLGDRVIIVRPDDRFTVIAFLSLLLLGAVPVMVNSRSSNHYLHHCITQASPVWIISGDSTFDICSAHRPAHTISSTQLLDLCRSGVFRAVNTNTDDVAYWLFTSGTTGAPRAAIHSHQSLRAVGECYGVHTDGMTSQDRVYATARLSFAYGICHSLASTLVAGASAVLTTKLPTPESIVDTIQQHQPTIFVTVPTVYSLLLDSDLDLSHLGLKQCTSAGENLSHHLQQRWYNRTSVPLLNLYGCTEFSGCVLATHLQDQSPGTVGTPTLGYQCEIRDRLGQPVPTGTVGELWIRGPSLALAYHDDTRAFDSGWFASRDLFIKDSRGRFIFQGRSDDMFKVHGQWVSPIEIEDVLMQQPDVYEAGVTGHITSDGLIEIVAHVVPRPGHIITEHAVRSHVRRRLEAHKCPRRITIVDQLPRTINGKLQRSLLGQIT